MKSKPVRHKNTNRFRFKPFSERINEIDIRHAVLYHIEHQNHETPAEGETNFYITLRKWRTLNLSESFKKFSSDVSDVITLPQLVHKRAHVIDRLQHYIGLADPLSLPSILEIFIAVVKDLREDFYPFFPQFFDILIKLLNTKDAEQLERILICLAYLFKILRIFLKKDISTVLKRIIPLLGDDKPQYINNFAAESFAFVARDVNDKGRFLTLVLNYFQSYPESVSGCGRLIFEIIKGVNGNFHSCAESFIKLLFQRLQTDKHNQQILFSVLTQTVSDMLTTIEHKHCELFWENIYLVTEDELKKQMADEIFVELILRLSGQALEFKDGAFIQNQNKLLLLLINVFGSCNSENVLRITSQISTLLLQSKYILLSQEHASIIIKLLLTIQHSSVLLEFVNNTINYSQFDILVLPYFIKFVIDSQFERASMQTLTKVCLRKSPLSVNGIKLFDWVKYPIDFGTATHKFMKKVKELLCSDFDVIEDCLCCLILLPHLNNIDTKHCLESLKVFYSLLLQKLKSSNDDKERRKLIFILGNCIETITHISDVKHTNIICEPSELMDAILPLLNRHEFLAGMQVLDLYLTALEHENLLSMELFDRVDGVIRRNLSSPYHEVRLITTHIYSLFESINLCKNSEIQDDNVNEKFQVFTLCYNTECITPSVQDYRTQLSMLRKMAFGTTQYTLVKHNNLPMYQLEYMFGILYSNFKLLWEPTIELITGFANGLLPDTFWPIFHRKLVQSFENCKIKPIINSVDEFHSNVDVFNEIYGFYNSIKSKPDFENYRIQILESMRCFTDVCEAKNRDIGTLFIEFIDNEYRKKYGREVHRVDVQKHENTETLTEIQNEITEDEDDNELSSSSGKQIFKTLINIIQLLAKFKNVKALYKETYFYNLCLEFLCHKNASIQKFALQYLLNYKNKSLTPYKENLNNLIDDNKFKDELTFFNITTESETINSNDRKTVMPIVMRILYSKMVSKVGTDKRGGGQNKRSIIIRYIAGCHDEEVSMFIQMAFPSFQKSTKMNVLEIFKDITENINLKCILPPSKLQSSINLIEVVREHLGGFMNDTLLGDILKIFYSISTTVSAILNESDKVFPGFIKTMKFLRNNCLSLICSFFQQFNKYQWSRDEAYVIFETLIWPVVDNLHIEGIHSPTVLLKLFQAWSENPRYYLYLASCKENHNENYPLAYVFKLLKAPKCNKNVVDTIMDMIERLLVLIEDDEDLKMQPLVTFNVSASIANAKCRVENINFGSRLLIPHVVDILDIIKRRFSNLGKNKTINKRDLTILHRITELVESPELCDDLLKLLLPILVDRITINMADDSTQNALNAVINLLNNSRQPETFLITVAPLFYKITSPEHRKTLCKMLFTIADNCSSGNENLVRLANVVNEMNAFSARWIDQPDFDRRLEAYKQLYKLSDINDIDLNLAIFIVNNCFFSIRTEKDISLRDSASFCMKKILPKIMLKYRSADGGLVLTRSTVLYLISCGLKDSTNEIHRLESVALLGVLTRESSEADVVLSDLLPLTNKEDMEVDFFENICHLQLHRRVRALLKFCKIAKTMSKCPTPKTLTNFILPLARIYLCNEKYTDKNTLIDASIDVLCTICRLLPWYHYELLLKHYLNKLRSSDHRKQLTRIIVGILDSFHYDLTMSANIELPKSLLVNMDNEAAIALSYNNDESMQEQLDDGTIDEELESEVIADETQETMELVNPYDKVHNIAPSTAKRIIKSLSSGLLPQLNHAISRSTDHDNSHKLNRKRTSLEREEEDMLKIPIALALVKLLQKLPNEILKMNLPSIFIKICTFLKSPIKQVRATAREILRKIMLTVGTTYLGILLEHMTALLTRGFQVHVLVSTIHSVLDALKDQFKPGELDANLQYILEVVEDDLFGNLSEEKEVDKLGNKTSEAKPSKKTYVTLNIVAKNISESSLIELMVPFKDTLNKFQSKKVVLKVEEAITNIATGLVVNKFIAAESLFVFLYGVASESIPELVVGAPKREITEEQRNKMIREKPDCFIIPPTPRRSREAIIKHVKTSSKANAHIMVEFSLNLLYSILKREKLQKKDYKAFLDPLIPILVDAIKSNHIKVTTVSMKCFTSIWNMRISTPTLIDSIKDIVAQIFIILHKYATFGINKQNENFHLVQSAFKAVTTLIRNVNYYTVDENQLKTLLLYTEQDCDNDEREANSFALLKAILDAKLDSREVHEIILKIGNISILSESARSRDNCREIYMNYLTNYKLGKKVEKHMIFFVTQLNYELQHGRESSLKFLELIISKFPISSLSKQSSFLFLSLGVAMVNDSSSECREKAAKCIELLLNRLGAQDRNNLFNLICTFFSEKKPTHIELAAQLCSRIIKVEKDEFKHRLTKILELIIPKLTSLTNVNKEGRFVRVIEQDTNDDSDATIQMESDHSLIKILILIENICNDCQVFLTNAKYDDYVDQIGQLTQTLLSFPHSWVRLQSVRVLNCILDKVNVNNIIDCIKSDDSERGFLYHDCMNSLRCLTLDLCAQLCLGVSKEMADQTVEALFKIIKLVNTIPELQIPNESSNEKTTKVNMRWILLRLRKALSLEMSKTPTVTTIRLSIFSMFIHLVAMLADEQLNQMTECIMVTLVREVTRTNPTLVELRQLAARVSKKIRRKLGDIEYSKLVADAQTKLNIKRAERKKIITQEKVTNPAKAIKRKLQLKEKKKIFKKKKIEMLQGKRPRPKKRKLDDIEIEDEFIS